MNIHVPDTHIPTPGTILHLFICSSGRQDQSWHAPCCMITTDLGGKSTNLMESWLTVTTHVGFFFHFKIISFMAGWFYFCIEFYLIVPCFNLARVFKSLWSSKNVICLQVVYALRYIAAIIAIIRGVCYGGSVIWCVSWDQKAKWNQAFFLSGTLPFHCFFLYNFSFFSIIDCFYLEEGRMTSWVTPLAWRVWSEGMWLTSSQLRTG